MIYNCSLLLNCISTWRKVDMAVSYVKLLKLLLDNGLKRSDLILMAGISTNILAKLGKNDFVSMESLENI